MATKAASKKTEAKAPVKKTAVKADVKAAPKKTSALHAAVFAADGTSSGEVALPKELFDGKLNQDLLAQAVRVYLANQREGSAKTKTRGEVEGSTRKIYRQKGTGKARHGGIRAPIFVGGGIVFGPVPRDYRLSMNKKMKRAALIAALSARRDAVAVVDGFEMKEPKTSVVAKAFAGMNMKGSVLFVVPSKADTLVRAARNLDRVDIIVAKDLMPYAILTHENIVFEKSALEESKAHFTK